MLLSGIGSGSGNDAAAIHPSLCFWRDSTLTLSSFHLPIPHRSPYALQPPNRRSSLGARIIVVVITRYRHRRRRTDGSCAVSGPTGIDTAVGDPAAVAAGDPVVADGTPRSHHRPPPELRLRTYTGRQRHSLAGSRRRRRRCSVTGRTADNRSLAAAVAVVAERRRRRSPSTGWTGMKRRALGGDGVVDPVAACGRVAVVCSG